MKVFRYENIRVRKYRRVKNRNVEIRNLTTITTILTVENREKEGIKKMGIWNICRLYQDLIRIKPT